MLMLLTIILKTNELLVKLINPFGAFLKANSISGHGIPLAYCSQLTFFILCCQIFQHCRVVYEGVQLPVHKQLVLLD